MANRKMFTAVVLVLSILVGGNLFAQEPGKRLSQVKVISLYENITDGVAIGRSIDDTIKILKDTHTDFILRGFWKWTPVLDSPDNIPPELLKLTEGKNLSLEKISGDIKKTGHYYQELKRWVSAIKKEIPGIIFCGAIPAQTLSRIELNPITGKVYNAEDTWKMALDPQKWNITHNAKPVTKEEFQSWFYGQHPYGGKLGNGYDRHKVSAYFPDITNPDFQELLLSWAKKQIDCGADAIWIDMLYHQAIRLAQITGDINHPAIKETFAAAARIVDEIHKYGELQGRYVYVGCWPAGRISMGKQLPYVLPKLDFITISPTAQEVENMELDNKIWDKLIPAIKETQGAVPIFAFIDWSFDMSQTVVFSQKLTTEQQRKALEIFDKSFGQMGVNFAYPVHGGYMGRGDITKKLSFGKFRIYDSLAPEFDTYEAIKELALKKAKSNNKYPDDNNANR